MAKKEHGLDKEYKGKSKASQMLAGPKVVKELAKAAYKKATKKGK